MSSWIIAKSSSLRKTPEIKEITSYHDVSSGNTFAEIYLKFIAAVLYTKSINETCNVWDPSGILRMSLKSTPLVSILKEKPSVEPVSLDSCRLKITEIQKLISNVFEYNPKFNFLLDSVLDTLSVRRSIIDLCIHLNDSISLEKYISMVKNYRDQFESKKPLTIYVMGNSDMIAKFKGISEPSWNILSLKYEADTSINEFIRDMAEVKLISMSSSMILDFSKPIDRLIYVLRKPKQELEYFKEVNRMAWFLV